MNNTIRFCCGPLKPEELTEDDRVVYQRHVFVYAAMGDMAWSLVELLNQCQYHEHYKHQEQLCVALVELQEIGMVRTEEATLLNVALKRAMRTIDGSFTFDDINVHDGTMSVRFGGNGSRWFMTLFANAAANMMKGVHNSLEMEFRRPEYADKFIVTVRRMMGKSPMQMRGDLLNAIKALIANGGATAEQLQAVLNDHDKQGNAPGLASWPDQEEHDNEYPWLVYYGDRLHCSRCNTEEKVAFPIHDVKSVIDAFLEHHKQCVPLNAASGDLLRALREEKRSS